MKEKSEKELKAKKVKESKKDKSIKTEKQDKKMKKDKKEKGTSKVTQTIKRKWLIDGTKTTILVLLILAIFFGISFAMQKLDLTPIDLSADKLYTLTDESKEKVKDISKDVNLYFVGYSEDDTTLDLAKQYTKENEKIKVETVTADDRPDLAQKYGFQSGDQAIIVECGDKYKVLSYNDLLTYDSTTYETINIAEEKLTSSIEKVVTDKVPKVYFLEGYGDFSLTTNMNYLSMYMQNEITEADTLNILTTGKVPDDCDTLIITTPTKDFDDVATNAITEYINNGGNILWFNSAVAEETNLPNVNKILAMYGVNPFELGVIYETDTSRMIAQSPNIIIPEPQYSKITEDLYSDGIILVNATKININEDELENLNVTKTDILKTSSESYFRTNIQSTSSEPLEGEEQNSFLVGAELEKTITEANEETGESAKTSKLIIYGENYFITDYTFSQNSQYPIIQLAYNNKDVALNSIAELVEREEDISARKSTGTVRYTATEQENRIILAIIFGVPVIIIIAGIIVWIVRQRKGTKGPKEPKEKKEKKTKK